MCTASICLVQQLVYAASYLVDGSLLQCVCKMCLDAYRYLQGKAQLLYPEPRDVFPCELIEGEVCRPPTSYL